MKPRDLNSSLQERELVVGSNSLVFGKKHALYSSCSFISCNNLLNL